MQYNSSLISEHMMNLKKNTHLPKVSIIILNWNGRKYIRECLTSLLNTIYPKDKLEIIVVDNASTDGSDKIIAQEFPEFILIRNQKNLGFCEGNNVGITHSKGDVIVLLNNDCFVDPKWLMEIAKVMNKPNVGIVGCKLIYPFSTIIQSCGCKEIFLGYWKHIAAGLDIKEFKCRDHFEVDYVSGVALAIKREVIEKIGLLDPCFYAYVEEVDWCYRAKRAGYKVVLSDAIVYHYGSASWHRFPLKQIYLMYRNKILFIGKHYPKIMLLKYFIEYPIKFTLESLLNFLKKRTVMQLIALKTYNRTVLWKSLKIYLLNIFFFYLTLIPGFRLIPSLKNNFTLSSIKRDCH